MAWPEHRRWVGYHGNVSAVIQTVKVIPKIVSGKCIFDILFWRKGALLSFAKLLSTVYGLQIYTLHTCYISNMHLA